MADQPRVELAEDRTHLAEDRTLLANERTFASWMRTGMASVGVGLGFNALFREIEHVVVAKSIATAFIFVGIFIIWAAERRSCQVQRRLEAHQVQTLAVRNLRIIALGLAIASVALIAAIWMLV